MDHLQNIPNPQYSGIAGLSDNSCIVWQYQDGHLSLEAVYENRTEENACMLEQLLPLVHTLIYTHDSNQAFLTSWVKTKAMPNFTHVILDDSYEYIYDYGFDGLVSLRSIRLSRYIYHIGKYAFRGCTALTQINIPEDVIIIDEYAFQGCESLHSIHLPESLHHINSFAFLGSGLWNREGLTCDDSGRWVLRCGPDVGETLVVPESVVGIASDAFSHGYQLKEVILPQGLLRIGETAFADCVGLTNLVIPDTVFSIGFNAFRGIPQITYSGPADTRVYGDFPAEDDEEWGLTNTRRYGENPNWGAENLVVPIPEPALSGSCGNTAAWCLTDHTLTVRPVGEEPGCIEDNTDHWGDLRQQIHHVILEEGIRRIGRDTFRGCNNLETVSFPNSLKIIAAHSFQDCKSLKTVTVPGSVHTIGVAAFACCPLESVTLEPGIRIIASEAFRNCALRQLSVPDSVTAIGNNTFGRNPLESVSLGQGLRSIGSYAFVNCRLSELIVPDTVDSIEREAFAGIPHLIYHGNAPQFVDRYDYVPNWGAQSRNRADPAPAQLPEGEHSGTAKVGENACILWQYREGVLRLQSSYAPLEPENDALLQEFLPTVHTVVYTNHSQQSFLSSWLCLQPLPLLTTAILDDSYEFVHDYGFADLTTLQTVQLPNTIVCIGRNAFEGCSSLTSVNIPEGVVIIDDYAFWGCESLQSILLPASLEEIRCCAFTNCGLTRRKALVCDDSVRWVLHCGQCTGDVVKVPDTVLGIAAHAFRGCYQLSDVLLPQGLRYIGEEAFSGCSSLNNLVIPDCVEKICINAFRGLSMITYFGSAPTWVYGFYNVISADHDESTDIASFGENPNWGARSRASLPLTAAPIHTGTCGKQVRWTFKDHVLCISPLADTPATMADYTDHWGDLRQEIRHIVIEEGIRRIGKGAFRDCKALQSVTLPNSLRIIAAHAFENCTSLACCFIPDSVTGGIGKYAFHNCKELAVINIPKGIRLLHSTTLAGATNLSCLTIGASVIGDHACRDCSHILSLTLLSGVCRIGDFAFYHSATPGLRLPEGICHIGKMAFSGCTIQELTVPGTVETIADSAFAFSDIRKLTLCEGIRTISPLSFSNNTRLKTLVIPESVTTLAENAFFNCTGLTFVQVRKTLSCPGNPFPLGCIVADRPLEQLNWQDGLLYDDAGTTLLRCPPEISGTVTVPNGVTTIAAGAFRGCEQLEEVILPDSVTAFGVLPFEGCKALTQVRLPQGLTAIPFRMFHNCSSLRQVEIPSSVKSIESHAFHGCHVLRHITLPEGLTFLGEKAFAACYKLRQITIPDTCLKLGAYLFSGCLALEQVTLPEMLTRIPAGCFFRCSKLERIRLPKNLALLGNAAFRKCFHLKNIHIPARTIGEEAFRECISLESVSFGEDTKTLGGYAFQECVNLRSISLPMALESLGEGCFLDCTAMVGISLPRTISTIPAGCFENCQSLLALTLPETVRSIEDCAFSGCTSLELTLDARPEHYEESAFDNVYRVYFNFPMTFGS